MSYHPTGETVEIVGLRHISHGRSCPDHNCCGEQIVKEDTIVRLRKVQIVNLAEKEETAIAAHWVSDGVDRCRVGFLPRHHVKHWKKYDGVLAQVTEVYDENSDSPVKRKKVAKNYGCALAALISPPPAAAPTTADDKKPPRSPKTKKRASSSRHRPDFIVRSPRKKTRVQAEEEENNA